ncbi:SDR family oxidoreductase [Legionella jordanis]|uniref:Short chain dehydrogenase/reductase family oxidoreductase n=1 Tax=Legionella jordanis TaxID=456 RepID=A0A0W0VE38_9GAMM|nr:SDR family oxidoreductase [Legionella jordanis]KTD18347.1 short chain dehydrogenase/reductase family oxidoreductase [Legionella jordanis]RMX05258.1 SDR family oxidoreductase [Legionella jordanis]RMX20891.1 SDR family oxidoreductase [Legionella jordanis]VEH13307.1 short chain dehydrogenase/reductase family oxidoreductase [Legionella jordanis]HAT8713655.1 SDR family NAD(P)-dependent oxidoreductase [Legionella jordanis]
MGDKKPLVVITGASEGIGRALAGKFAETGHPCLLISRHIQPLPELKNYEVTYAQLDVCDYEQFKTAVLQAESRYGKTECLINNAGLIHVGEFRDMPIEKAHYEMDVLLKGVVNGIKIVLSDMSARKSGTIINISSIGDRKPAAQGVIYHASKHAVRSISESLQMAEAKNHVRVMNIAPGLIKTNIHAKMGISFEKYCELLGNPSFIMPEELAEIIMFCWRLPQRICIRDLVVMPSDCDY